MKTQTIFLVLATLSSGIMAGIFFTWSNAVTTGLGHLKDIEYLRAFQAMNKSILNLPFLLSFLGPALFIPIYSSTVYKSNPSFLFWMMIIAGTIYILGVIMVTFGGNIPLNKMLGGTALDDISLSEAGALRSKFENKWNFFNYVRTFSSLASFLLLIMVCIQSKI